MNPEQAKFLLGIYLSSLRREGATTRKVLAAVPRDKGSYRPHPNSRSALELAWHLASADIWFLDSFLAGQFSMEDDTMPADIADSADVVAYFDDEFESKLAEVEKLPAEFWVAPLAFFGIYNHPAVFYLQFMLSHSIHHRGQLTAYLRPMGAKVPNIYGGSFDEPMQFSEES